MINENLQQQIEQLEQQIKDLKLKFAESKAEPIPYRPYKVKVSEDIDDYVCITNAGNTFDLNTLTIVGFEEIFKRGLAFKTKEEAKQYDKERILLFKLHKWAEEHNGDWTPDWENCGNKYIVKYIQETRGFEIAYTWSFNYFSKLPVFKSEKIALEFIKEFGEEIKEVLC